MRVPAEFRSCRSRVHKTRVWGLSVEDMDREELLTVVGYLCERLSRAATVVDLGRPRLRARVTERSA